jgi:Protein of unknown function (DUF3768)
MTTRTAQIAKINDECRSNLSGLTINITSGVRALGNETVLSILYAVATFNSFTEDNDPHNEHGFGAFTHDGNDCYWKIDYYAPDMLHGSVDPTDQKQTVRVLTIMLAEEY